MAKIIGGFPFTISGKIGNFVFSNIHGKNVIRPYQPNVKNPKTPGQVNQRNKFALIVQFLKQFSDILKIGFHLKAHRQTAFNAAVSYNIKNAIIGIKPNLEIDFSKVMIAQGNRLPAFNASLIKSTTEEIILTVEPNCLQIDDENNDLAFALFYNSTQNKSITSLGHKHRFDWRISIHPQNWKTGDEVHGWIFYTSHLGKKVSDSTYAGSIKLK